MALYERGSLKRSSIHKKFSMTGQENVTVTEVTEWSVLTTCRVIMILLLTDLCRITF